MMKSFPPFFYRWVYFLAGMLVLANVAACNTAGRQTVSTGNGAESVVLTFAGPESDRQFYELLMDAFHEQNPGITVQFVALPGRANATNADSYYRRLASSGDTFVLGDNPPTHVSQYLTDLQPLMESDADFAPDDFWPGALDACRDREGRLSGIPVHIGFQGIFYDQQAFRSAGLPLPQPAWTWDDFRTAATTLAQVHDGRYSYAESAVSLLSSLIGAAIEDAEGELHAAALQPHIQWYLDLVNAGVIYLLPTEWTGQEQPLQVWENLFESENHPVMWSGSLAETLPGHEAIVSNADTFAKAAFEKYGFVPYPVGNTEAEKRTSPAWAECVAISTGSQRPREAWAWLSFLSRRRWVRNPNDIQEIVYAPARISVTESSSYWEDLPDELEASVRYMLQHAWYGTAYPESLAAVREALLVAATGQNDFATALKTLMVQLALTPQPTPNLTPIAVATPKPVTPADVLEIRYGYQTFGEVEQAIKAAAAAYNQEHPNVMVNISTDLDIPETSPLVYLTDNFDCFTSRPFLWDTRNLDRLLPIDALMDAEGTSFIQDFPVATLDAFRYEGALYGLPAYSIVPVMTYNADLLAKRGLQPPDNDWTFYDFVEMMNTAASTARDDRSYGFIFNPFDFLLLEGRGARWADFTSNPPVPAFDSPEFASGLDWIRSLIQSGVLLIDQDFATSRQAITSGQVAFWITMLEFGDYWFSGQRPNFNIGVAPLPRIETAPRMFSWGIDGHFISSKVKEPQHCWGWIRFLSGQPAIFNGIPARVSVAQSPEWEAVVGTENAAVYRVAVANAMQETLKAQKVFVYSPMSTPLFWLQQQAVTAMVEGQNYHDLLPELQKKAEDYVACMSTVDRTGLNEGELFEEIDRCARQADVEED